jgi:hypothetical protein
MIVLPPVVVVAVVVAFYVAGARFYFSLPSRYREGGLRASEGAEGDGGDVDFRRGRLVVVLV